MYRFCHSHEYRSADGAAAPKAVVFYEETAAWHWWDFLAFWRKTTNIYILEGCKFNSVPREPYQTDQGAITIDGQDVYELLKSMGMKGLIKLRCSATKNDETYVKSGWVYLKDSDCRLRLGFAHRKSAMMAKLVWGSSKLSW